MKEVNNTWKKLFKLFLSFLLVCLLLVLLLAFCLLALFGGWCIEMKTYEKLRNATSVKEAEKIMKEFWDSYVESEEHGRILQSIYDCYNSGMDKNDPCLVKLSKDLEREERRLWIEHGLYPEDYDFDRVLTEEEAKRAIEWFGGSQGE